MRDVSTSQAAGMEQADVAIARIAGWSAHRIEELVSVNKIIRPSYKSLVKKQDYVGRDDR